MPSRIDPTHPAAGVLASKAAARANWAATKAEIEALQAAGPGGAVRYVSLSGDDANDGSSWLLAKRTVAAAVKSLPIRGIGDSSGGDRRYAGQVIVGPGEFVETDTPIPCNAELRVSGRGTAGTHGTQITLGPGRNTHLFSYEDGTFSPYLFDGWGHHILFENMRLFGNKANNSGDCDLLRLKSPGFNCGVFNIYFEHAPRYGLALMFTVVNFYSYNLTAAGCISAAIYIQFTASANLGNAAFFGTQIDNCGLLAPIQIVSQANGNNTVAFYGLETEAFTQVLAEDLHHNSVIHYTPESGSNGVTLIAQQLTPYRGTSGDPLREGVAVIYEAPGSGGSLRYVIGSIMKSGYTNSFHSDRTAGRTIASSIEGIATNRFVEVTDPFRGFILRSSNGTRYRLTVSDDGLTLGTAPA